MGIGRRIVFSLQLLGAAPSSAVLWRRDVPEEKRCEAKGRDGVHRDSVVLFLPPNIRCIMAA